MAKNVNRDSTFMELLVLAFVAIFVSACSDGNDSRGAGMGEVELPAVNPYTGYSSALYDEPTNWLCRPDIEGKDNACDGDLTATIIFADGSTQLEYYEETEDQTVDCFYAYPTVSQDSGLNADFVAARETIVTYLQVARYRSVCKLYAPLHRQFTLEALATAQGDDLEAAAELAYSDVLDAFKQFIANNDGRPFLLIGHSQGAGYIGRLIQEEIESDPYLYQRLVSAHAIGLPIELPNDAEIGGSFAKVPPCSFDDETGCFVNYSSFYADDPTIGDAGFASTQSPDTRAACTNPVDLGGGRLELDAYFSFIDYLPFENPADTGKLSTLFFKVPGHVYGECIERDGLGYLAITVNEDPADALVDNVGSSGSPGWGLHSSDIPLAQGDLVRLARRQVEAWSKEQM